MSECSHVFLCLTGKLLSKEAVRHFELLRRQANHLLLQLQCGHHRLRANVIAWSLFGGSWLFASASFAATTESKAVLYQTVYILLACMQGVSFLGMTMLDPQRRRHVTILLFPPNQQILEYLHIRSDLGTHVPLARGRSMNDSADSHGHLQDHLWGGGGPAPRAVF